MADDATCLWQAVPARFARALAGLDPGPLPVAAYLEQAKAAIDARLARQRRGNSPLRRGAPLRLVAIGAAVNDTAIHGCPIVDALLVLDDDQRPPEVAIGDFCHRFRCAVAGARPVARSPDDSAADTPWVIPRAPARRSATETMPLASTLRLRPAFALNDDRFLVPAADGWQWWMPHEHRRRIDAADAASDGNARRLIRLAKLWRDTCGVPLPSPRLDRLVCRFLDVWPYRRRSLFFADWMVRDFLFWLSAEPAPPGVPDWRHRAAESWRIARAASDNERDGETLAALLGWQELFGTAFPDAPAVPAPSEPDADLAEMSAVRQVAERVRRLREGIDAVDHRP